MRVAIVDVDTLARNWWVVLLRGLAGILFGIGTLLAPGITAIALTYVVAAWALITGFEVAAAFRLRKVIAHEWLLALSGAASIVLGVMLMLAPLVGALVLVLWIGAYALVSGALLVALNFRLRSWGRSPHGSQAMRNAHAFA